MGAGGVPINAYQATGGNPGGFGSYTNSISCCDGQSELLQRHIAKDFVFDPSVEGEIQWINASIDWNYIGATGCGLTCSGHGFGLLLHQNGTLYVGPGGVNACTSAGWNTFSAALLNAANFVGPGGPADNPDFSASAPPISVGFYVGNSAGGAACAFSRTVGYDNLTFAFITPASPGPRVLAVSPKGTPMRPITGAAVDTLRIVFSEEVAFQSADFSVTSSDGSAVGVSTSGSPAQVVTLSLSRAVGDATLTVEINDSVVSTFAGAPLDGDADGTAGGVFIGATEHRRFDPLADLDVNRDGLVDFLDVLTFLQVFDAFDG